MSEESIRSPESQALPTTLKFCVIVHSVGEIVCYFLKLLLIKREQNITPCKWCDTNGRQLVQWVTYFEKCNKVSGIANRAAGGGVETYTKEQHQGRGIYYEIITHGILDLTDTSTILLSHVSL